MIHEANDGLGPRDVYVDGKFIDKVYFADTSRGVVRCYRTPLKFDKWGKRVLTKTVRGHVIVQLKAREDRVIKI